MKNSLASILFLTFCFVMVFNSCDLGLDLGDSPEGVIISPKKMRGGDTYEFKVEATDPDGDSLTYSWSVEVDEPSSSLGQVNKGRLHSRAGSVVSYTAPEGNIPGDRLRVKCTVSDGTFEAVFIASYINSNFIMWI